LTDRAVSSERSVDLLNFRRGALVAGREPRKETAVEEAVMLFSRVMKQSIVLGALMGGGVSGLWAGTLGDPTAAPTVHIDAVEPEGTPLPPPAPGTLPQRLCSEDYAVSQAAIAEFQSMPPKEQRAQVPAILNADGWRKFPASESGDMFYCIREPLRALGPSLPSLLEKYRRDKDPNVRRTVVRLVGELGQAGRTVKPLTAALSDPDAEVKRAAISQLDALGPSAAGAVNGLIPLLRDPNWQVAYESAKALEHIGTAQAQEALQQYRLDQKRQHNY
jgi:hypothetical protein